MRHNLVASTNHASPSGSLPFLLPALSSDRLDARHLLPITSSRLDLYAQRHGSLPSTSAPPPSSAETPDQQHLRQQAYQALLDSPIRNAWLYALYLSPANERLLRRLYITPVSRASPVQHSLLTQLRAAARAEIAKAPDTPIRNGWELTGNIGDVLTWALSGRTVLDPDKIYADARRAMDALEALLAQNTNGGVWFFDAARPTLFDAHVFSYTHLILEDDYILPDVSNGDGTTWKAEEDERLAELAGKEGLEWAEVAKQIPGHSASSCRMRYERSKELNESSAECWGDDTLRKIVRDCPRLMEHAETMLRTYWPEK